MSISNLFSFLLIFSLTSFACAQGVGVKQSDGPYGRQVALTNSSLSVTIYPDWGARIGQFIDKKDNRNLVWWDTPPEDANWHGGMGGLLDDRGEPDARYAVQIVEQTDSRVSVRLTSTADDRGLVIEKTITVVADRPRLDVTYHYANHGQDPIKDYGLAIRNFLYVSGGPPFDFDWAQQRVFLPTTKTVRELQETVGKNAELVGKMQTEVIPTWNGFIDRKSGRGVAFAFEDGWYRWFYRWIKGTTGTYEIMFNPLGPGQEVTTRFSIGLTHGLNRYTDVAPGYALDFQAENQQASLRFVATASDLRQVVVKSRVRSLDSQQFTELPAISVGDAPADRVCQTNVPWPKLPETGVLEQQVFAADRLIGQYELPIPTADPPQAYQRAKTARSEPKVATIPGWKKTGQAIDIKPTDADRQRGYMIYLDQFAASDEERGRATDAVRFELGRGEFESVALVLRNLGDAQRFTIAADNPLLMVRVQSDQELPGAAAVGKPDIRGFRLDPASAVEAPTGQDRIVWLTLDARKLNPGQHAFKVEFQPQRGSPQQVRVEATVQDVSLPPRNVFELEVEGYLFLTFMQLAEGKPERFATWIRDLAEHRVNIANMFNGIEARGLPLEFMKLRSTGQPVTAQMLQDPEFQEPLDLSAYDSWIQPMIDGGLVRCYDRESGLEPRTTRQRWLMRELARYLGERGYSERDRYVKFVDEEPAELFPKMAQTGKMYQELGWRVLHTCFPTQSKAQLGILNPYTDLWHGPIRRYELVAQRRAEGLIDARDEVWTYEGWGAVWIPYGARRSLFHEAVHRDLNGYHLHVYYRDKMVEALIWPTPEGPVASAAWEGTRDGIEDAQYYALARQVVANLQKHAPSDPLASRLKTDLAAIDALVEKHGQGMPYGVALEIKRQAIGLLKAVKAAKAPLRRSASYGFTTLAETGRPNFTLAGSDPLTSRFAQQFQERTSIPYARPDAKTTLSIEVLLRDDPAVRDLAQQKVIPMSPTYPAAGSYAIWRVDTKEPVAQRILLVGGDEAGALRAIGNFIRFLRVDPELF